LLIEISKRTGYLLSTTAVESLIPYLNDTNNNISTVEDVFYMVLARSGIKLTHYKKVFVIFEVKVRMGICSQLLHS
jgi:hypothetical protein